MERRMRRALEEIGFAPGLAPAADVYETADEFVVEVEAPGYDEKELSIEVWDHTLADEGFRWFSETTEEKRKAFALHERLERAFERRLRPPQRGGHRACEGGLQQGRARSARSEAAGREGERGRDQQSVTRPGPGSGTTPLSGRQEEAFERANPKGGPTMTDNRVHVVVIGAGVAGSGDGARAECDRP